MSQTFKVSLLTISMLLAGLGALATVAAAQEHEHPAARPAARGPAPGRAVDGRGQVLDARYNHGRYYPPAG